MAVVAGLVGVAGTLAGAAVSTAVIGAGISAVGGAIQSGEAHKSMVNARNAKEAAAFKVKELQDGRQDIINPYAGVTDLSGMAEDLTGLMNNILIICI